MNEQEYRYGCRDEYKIPRNRKRDGKYNERRMNGDAGDYSNCMRRIWQHQESCREEHYYMGWAQGGQREREGKGG